MSLQTAMAALNAATPTTPETAAPEMPQNMANGGANEPALTDRSLANQPRHEIKENDNKGSQKIADATPGVVDATKSAAETTPDKPAPISSQFAALAKKEKALVKQQADIKAREAAYAAKEAAYVAREAAIAEREAKIKEADELWDKNPIDAIQKRGQDYNKFYNSLTNQILSGKAPEAAPEDPKAYADRIAAEIRKEFEGKEAARAEAARKAEAESKAKQEAEVKEAEANYYREVEMFTKENEVEYEFINMFGQQELVIDTVKAYYDKHKRVLSVKEASDMVEKYLTDEAERTRSAKKFSKANAPEKKPESKNDLKQPSPTKTLTNNLTPTMSSPLPAATDAERMRRALNKLNDTSR